MRRSGDRARAEASAIGGKRRRRGRSQEDDRGLTFELNEFGVRERNSAEIGLASSRDARMLSFKAFLRLFDVCSCCVPC